MARVRLKGKINNFKVGASSESNVDIASNVVFVRWGDRPNNLSPELTAAQITPLGWNHGHKWGDSLVVGVLSEAKDAYYDQAVAYIDDDGENPNIPYFYFTLEDHNGSSKSVTVTGACVDHTEYNTQAFESMITEYHHKYYYATPPT